MFNNVCTIFTHIISNIVYVIAHCIIIIFIMVNMIIVGIKLPKRNLALYLILFFLAIILAILGGILIYYVQRKKKENQAKIKTLIFIALIITILFLVFAIVEEIVISIDYSKIKTNKCFTEKVVPYGVAFKKNNFGVNSNSNLKRVLSDSDIDININDCINSYLFKTVKRYSYTTLTFIEILSIISIIYWIQNKKKHVDQPIETQQIINIVQPVVVQPSSVVINPMQINNGYITSPGQQYYPNYYPQQANILYSNNQMIYTNAYPAQQYIINNPNKNLDNNNYPAQQNINQNSNIEQQNIKNENENNLHNHAIDEDINNVKSSDREVNNQVNNNA